uniref:Ferric-chelate reductase 1 n=1 Tax=Leptobrachium leishanense TaxID=445787 RepID=A0A8C5QAV1_9ANUR
MWNRHGRLCKGVARSYMIVLCCEIQAEMGIPLVFAVCLITCFVAVLSYPSGLVTDSCFTMLPSHRNNVQQSGTVPFNITVSRNTFYPGDVITVTINAVGSEFKGFLLQARTLGSNRIVGTFTLTNSRSRILSCNTTDSTVSHINNYLKASITANWTAPTGLGPIRFRATVLKDYYTFWYGVDSEIITSLQISSETCGIDKFCLTNPANCNPTDTSCFFMSSVGYSGGYAFEMSGPSTGYLATGFSDDNQMGNDDVYICAQNSSGSILIQHAFNTGKTQPTILAKNTAANIMTRYVNGILQCSFTAQSNISTTYSALTRASTNPTYYIFLATGASDTNGQIQKHTKSPLISDSKVDLSSFTIASSHSGASSVILGHGALMLIAWMTTGSIGMLMARYMKNVAEKPLLGKAIWYQTSGAHPVLGCIVMILSFFQPIFALFRPDPKSKRRFIFNWGHLLNAIVIKILAVATIFLGFKLIDSTTTLWLSKVMGGFFAWEILFYILFEVNKHLKLKNIYETDEKKTERLLLGAFVCGNLAFLIALLVGIGSS